MALLRFAPSPTGSFHLGGLRIVLFNHLLSRKLGGKWLLRIEDTDSTRYVPGSVEELLRGLEWAGLPPDYGPFTGPHSPYIQSQRLDLYKSYADRLLEQRHAYRCFCSPDSLVETRARLASLGSNATYDRKCLHLTDEEVHRRVRAGEKHVVRLLDTAVPARSSVNDLVFGAFKDVHTSLPTDTILMKSDNFPTYHLASVVDDHEMGISHVIRGEEWLASLPLHLDMYACLHWTPPEFGHIPLLLNEDGSKMSKRATGMHVARFIDENFEPEAVLNWIFLLGLSMPAFEEGFFTMRDMQNRFGLDSFSTHRTIMMRSKLLHLNSSHLQYKALPGTPERQSLASRACTLVKTHFPTLTGIDENFVIEALRIVGDRVETLPQLPQVAPYLFVPPNYNTPDSERMKASVPPEVYYAVCNAVLSQLAECAANPAATVGIDLERLKDSVKSAVPRKGSPKAIMVALRHALTGMSSGPPLLEIMNFLGWNRVAERMRTALSIKSIV